RSCGDFDAPARGSCPGFEANMCVAIGDQADLHLCESVRFEARTGATGGSVEIPAGTVLSTGHNTTQELMLGVALKADLGPNERFSVRVETYCLQSSRTPPRQGALMSVVREAPANHRQVLAARSRFDQGDLQSAIWALADGLRHSNPVLDFVGVKAPVLRASRRQQPSTRQPNTTRVSSVLE
ncbi:MAG: hypothetical protein AAF645_18040, partial [Myxococcota bacterium]